MNNPPPLDGFFDFDYAGERLSDLDTPVPVIDIDVVARNLARWQQRCDALGLANRPHIKTHKLIGLAKYQLALGAKGITVQKLGEAEVMAGAGIKDMLLTFNVLGDKKVERLGTLIRQTTIAVVADNAEMLPGLAAAAQKGGRKLDILVECDTGMGRNGVQSTDAALTLARAINANAELTFKGLMTYPKGGTRIETSQFLARAREQLHSAGLDCPVISSGGTPDMWSDEGLAGITEYRAGTYAYFDRSLVERGACSMEECALTVLTTVVSRPTGNRAMIDAGTKSLTSDMLGMQGFGIVPALACAKVYDASEEHGFVDVASQAEKPHIGARLRVLPNHVCPVSNLFDKVVFVRGEKVLGSVNVDARGCVT